MKQVCALWLVVMFCVAVVAEEPKKADDEDYLKYALPKNAKTCEANARPGYDFVVYVQYSVGDEQVGTRRYWDREKTKLHSEVLLKEGKEHGLQRTWHQNGLSKSESPYKDGQRHGTFKQWDEKGKLLGSFVMKEGTGTFQDWYPNGQTDHLKPYKNGKYHGELRTYFDTGKLFQVITYKNGETHGVSYVWTRAGELEAGYPKCYLRDKGVSKEKYLKAAETDKSLPPIETGAGFP